MQEEAYLDELLEGDLAVHVLVSLDDGTVDKLLQLDVIQVGPNHHLKHGEELAVANESVIVDVVDLEGKSKLFLLARASRQTVQTLHEFQERDVSVFVLVQDCDHPLH